MDIRADQITTYDTNTVLPFISYFSRFQDETNTILEIQGDQSVAGLVIGSNKNGLTDSNGNYDCYDSTLCNSGLWFYNHYRETRRRTRRTRTKQQQTRITYMTHC